MTIWFDFKLSAISTTLTRALNTTGYRVSALLVVTLGGDHKIQKAFKFEKLRSASVTQSVTHMNYEIICNVVIKSVSSTEVCHGHTSYKWSQALCLCIIALKNEIPIISCSLHHFSSLTSNHYPTPSLCIAAKFSIESLLFKCV